MLLTKKFIVWHSLSLQSLLLLRLCGRGLLFSRYDIAGPSPFLRRVETGEQKKKKKERKKGNFTSSSFSTLSCPIEKCRVRPIFHTRVVFCCVNTSTPIEIESSSITDRGCAITNDPRICTRALAWHWCKVWWNGCRWDDDWGAPRKSCRGVAL